MQLFIVKLLLRLNNKYLKRATMAFSSLFFKKIFYNFLKFCVFVCLCATTNITPS